LGVVVPGRAREAFDLFVGPGFRHHNQYFKGDGDSMVEAMEQTAIDCPQKILEIHQVMVEGDRAAVMSWIRPYPEDRGAPLPFFSGANRRVVGCRSGHP